MAESGNDQKESNSEGLKVEHKYQLTGLVLLGWLAGLFSLAKEASHSCAIFCIIPAFSFAFLALLYVIYHAWNDPAKLGVLVNKYGPAFAIVQMICMLCTACCWAWPLGPKSSAVPMTDPIVRVAPGTNSTKNAIVPIVGTNRVAPQQTSVAANDIIMNMFKPDVIAGFAGSVCLFLGGIFIHLGCAQYFRAIGDVKNGSKPINAGDGGHGFWAETRMFLEDARAKLRPVYELRRIWDVYMIFGCLSVILGLMSISDVVFIDQTDGFACLRPLQFQFALCFVAVFVNNLLCQRFSGQTISMRFVLVSLLMLLIVIAIGYSGSFFFVRPSYHHNDPPQGIIDPVQAGPAFILFPIMMFISLCFILWGKWRRSTARVEADSRIAAIVKDNELRFYPFYLRWNILFNLTGMFIYVNVVFFPRWIPTFPPHSFIFLVFFLNACYVFFYEAFRRRSDHKNIDSSP